jgi:hypothetical protein
MIPMTRIILLFILVLFVLPNTIGAQQRSQKKTQPELKELIVSCIATVRKEIDNHFGFKASQFDAYIVPDGRIKFFGTQKEQFSFIKCMNERGYPLE